MNSVLGGYIFALGVGPMPRDCMSHTISMTLIGYMYAAAIVPILDICVEQIGVLARAEADGPGVGDGVLNDTGADKARVSNVAASIGLLGEVSIRARDFRGFLPKLESISRIIIYESKFSPFSHIVISASVYGIGTFLSNT